MPTDVSKQGIGERAAKNPLHSVNQLFVTANVVPSSLILSTLMMEALRSSET
jgi:hypothetical protein